VLNEKILSNERNAVAAICAGGFLLAGFY